MKQHPILFNAAMVRAILDGRKTQTRRGMKPQPAPFRLGDNGDGPECEVHLVTLDGQKPRVALGRVITGQEIPWSVGDHLWVRETWAQVGDNRDDIHGCPDLTRHVYYRADSVQAECLHWRPSIHMPRWASRITLEVTAVRVQRLQDISEEDARAEGVTRPNRILEDDGTSYTDGFAATWDDIYGPDAWDANPWVFATTFRRVQP